jgi:predicted Zn-dependent protease
MATASRSAFCRHPADGLIADTVAAMLMAQKDPRALSWLDRALFVGPHDPIAHRLTAHALAMAGHREQSVAELHAAFVDDEPDAPAPLLEALAIFPDDGDAARLRDSLPANVVTLHTALARLAQLRRWRFVVAVGDKALDGDARDVTALRHVVLALLQLHDKERLLDRAHALADLDPSPAGTTLAAQALVEMGQTAEAIQRLDASFAHDPEPQAAIQLARMALTLHDFEHARTALQTAIAHTVNASDKAQLHAILADVEEQSGHVNRAAIERAESARWSDRQN